MFVLDPGCGICGSAARSSATRRNLESSTSYCSSILLQYLSYVNLTALDQPGTVRKKHMLSDSCQPASFIQASPCPTLSPSLPQLGLRADVSMYCFWYVSRAHLLGSRSYVHSSKIFTLEENLKPDVLPTLRPKLRIPLARIIESSCPCCLVQVIFRLHSYTPGVCAHLLACHPSNLILVFLCVIIG